MENTLQKVVDSHGKHTTEGRRQSWKTHHRRSWKGLQNHLRCCVVCTNPEWELWKLKHVLDGASVHWHCWLGDWKGVRSGKKKKKKKNLFFAQKPNIKMKKHVNKVWKATGIAEAITAGRQQNKQQYLINEKERKHRDQQSPKVVWETFWWSSIMWKSVLVEQKLKVIHVVVHHLWMWLCVVHGDRCWKTDVLLH